MALAKREQLRNALQDLGAICWLWEGPFFIAGFDRINLQFQQHRVALQA